MPEVDVDSGAKFPGVGIYGAERFSNRTAALYGQVREHYTEKANFEALTEGEHRAAGAATQDTSFDISKLPYARA